MIVVKVKGGLGNQLFQYALGLELATRNNQELFLDTTWYELDHMDTPRRFMLDYFQLSFKLAENHEINRFLHKPLIIQKIYQRIFKGFLPVNKQKFIIEKDNHFNKNILEIKNNAYIDGTWMNENYFPSVRNVLKEKYTKKPHLNDYYYGIEQKINSENSICIHVRRGDYVSNKATMKYHGLTTLDYYHKAIDQLNRNIKNPVYYFFSDDIQWVKDNLKKDINAIYVSKNYVNSDLQEFYLMSICKHHIITNSTFSWWAAWLNNNNDKLICAPRRWSSKIPDSKILLPKDWTIID